MKLGAQFFSIRDHTRTPEDLRKSFEQMSRVGYEVAQMSKICSIDPYLLKTYSEEFSLPIICTHSEPERIFHDTEAIIREHIIYSSPVVGIAAMPDKYRGSLEGLYAFLSDIAEPMRKIEAAGLKFAYHNHEFEFTLDGDKPYLDIMIEASPTMNFILDTYWVRYAGYDPLDYIKKIGPSRMDNIHLKDMQSEPHGGICRCGAGVMNFGEIKKLCDDLAIPYALVEQDNAPDSGDSFAEMRASFESLKKYFK